MEYEIKEIKTEQELKNVLEICYRILGGEDSELYIHGNKFFFFGRAFLLEVLRTACSPWFMQ